MIIEGRKVFMALKGQDLLGAAMYQSNAFAGFSGDIVGVFDNTFKDPMSLIVKFIQANKIKAVIAQLHWADNHQASESQFETIGKRGKRWNDLKLRFPHIDVYVSGMCEHRKFSTAKAEKLKKAVMKYAPDCIYVNNPETPNGTINSAVLPNTINYVHGYKVKKPGGPYMISADGFIELRKGVGAQMTDVNTEKWVQDHSGAVAILNWLLRYNLRKQDTDKPPQSRTAKPDVGHIKTAVRIMYEKGPRPTFSFPVKWDLPKGWIYKTTAEDEEGGDGRANRPVFITKYKGDWTIKASNGKKLGVLKYYGTYSEPGFHRAYSGKSGRGTGINLYAAEIGEKAKKESGNEHIALVDGKGNAYALHPAFRYPYRG